jgi:hypothetical protein
MLTDMLHDDLVFDIYDDMMQQVLKKKALTFKGFKKNPCSRDCQCLEIMNKDVVTLQGIFRTCL